MRARLPTAAVRYIVLTVDMQLNALNGWFHARHDRHTLDDASVVLSRYFELLVPPV